MNPVRCLLAAAVTLAAAPAPAAADCLDPVARADREGRLDEAIALSRDAIDRDACRDERAVLRLYLADLLRQRGRLTGAVSDHCEASALYADISAAATGVIRRTAAEGDRMTRTECRAARALAEGDPIAAITQLEGFAARNAGAESGELRAMVDGIPDRIARIEAEHTGAVTVPCPAGGRVRLEGRDEQPCPASWRRVPAPRRHAGRYLPAAGAAIPFAVDVTPDATATVTPGAADTTAPADAIASADATADGPPRWLWPALTGAGALVAAAGAAWIYSKQAELVDDPAIRTDLALRDRYEGNAIGYYTLLGVGGALAVATVTLLLVGGDEPTAQVRVGPGGVGVSGRF